MDTVTTIVTPAATPVRLTTKEHVRDDLKITSGADDIYIDRLIDSQSESVIRYCGRTFAVETIQDVFYPGRVRGGQYRVTDDALQLTRWPITAVTSVTETGADGTATVLVANTDYIRRDIYGQLIRLNTDGLPCRWLVPKITVIYQAGYTLPAQTKTGETYTLPRSLEEVAIRLVKLRFLERSRDPLVKAENIPGVIDRQYWVDMKSDGNLPPDIREVLDQFRVPAVG